MFGPSTTGLSVTGGSARLIGEVTVTVRVGSSIRNVSFSGVPSTYTWLATPAVAPSSVKVLPTPLKLIVGLAPVSVTVPLLAPVGV